MKVLILSLALSMATASALTLPEALARAEGRVAVVNAQLDYDDGRRALARSQADPLALRLELLQAEQRVALAEAQLEQARYQAFAEIAQGYTQVLEAQFQHELAQAGRDLNAQALEIARIRLERGSGTSLDVQDAETNLKDADQNVDAARQGVELAHNNLQGLTGLEVDSAEPVPFDLDAVALPPLDDMLARLSAHPSLLQANQGLELARLGRDLLDPSYASRAQIEAAELQIEQAQGGTKEAQRGLELQLRSLYNSTVTARQSLVIARESLANAQEREQIERQRLEAGLIAEISYRQTRFVTLQAAFAAVRAEHGHLRALLDLQAGAITPLGGLDGF